VRIIHDSADTIHKSAQSTANLRVTGVTTFWFDVTDNVERKLATWFMQQNQQNIPCVESSFKRRLKDA
jgi:hypothetical protein